jgi:hypothetical protein
MRAADLRNLDPVAEPTNAQNRLSLADGKGNRDQLGLARQQHGRETHHGMLFGIAILPDHRVDGGHHVPAIGFAHPVGDGRSVRTQFGCHGLALAHRVIELIGL